MHQICHTDKDSKLVSRVHVRFEQRRSQLPSRSNIHAACGSGLTKFINLCSHFAQIFTKFVPLTLTLTFISTWIPSWCLRKKCYFAGLPQQNDRPRNNDFAKTAPRVYTLPTCQTTKNYARNESNIYLYINKETSDKRRIFIMQAFN